VSTPLLSNLKRVVERRKLMSQSFTFVDSAGNRAQYTVFDKDNRDQFHWFTEHGAHGFAKSYNQAQYDARVVLKTSMAANRRSAEATQTPTWSSNWPGR
jgi:hypothetical protein